MLHEELSVFIDKSRSTGARTAYYISSEMVLHRYIDVIELLYILYISYVFVIFNLFLSDKLCLVKCFFLSVSADICFVSFCYSSVSLSTASCLSCILNLNCIDWAIEATRASSKAIAPISVHHRQSRRKILVW